MGLVLPAWDSNPTPFVSLNEHYSKDTNGPRRRQISLCISESPSAGGDGGGDGRLCLYRSTRVKTQTTQDGVKALREKDIFPLS